MHKKVFAIAEYEYPEASIFQETRRKVNEIRAVSACGLEKRETSPNRFGRPAEWLTAVCRRGSSILSFQALRPSASLALPHSLL